ncbi:MAG: winged helix-turn-helix domain-containing protein [Arachnia sp.]
MKQPPPTLSPLLRSDLQGDLLSALFLAPDEENSLTDLARRLGAGLTTVHTEVERLATAGLVIDRRVGRARLVRANVAHPLAPALTQLLTLTYGPETLLPRLLRTVRGIERAYLVGPWAARRAGTPGAFPERLDVVLVGDVPSRAAARVAATASRALQRDVRVTVFSRAEWCPNSEPAVELALTA